MAEIYKIYQLIQYFVLKNSYNAVYVRGLSKENESFLLKKDSNNYKLIHITTDSLDDSFFEKDRLETFKKVFKINDNNQVLDIHICQSKVLGNELYDTICIDENYYDGIDVEESFPGIKYQIHYVENGQEEINSIVKELNNAYKVSKKQKIKLKYNKFTISNIVIIVSILLYVCVAALTLKGVESSTAYILLGADYKIFTSGLHQYWRLFTSSFHHGSIVHLALNCYSLYIMGNYFESELGKLKYALLLFGGFLAGSLTFGIFTTNTMSFGLSAGLYAILGYTINMIISNQLRIDRQFFSSMIINLWVNILPFVAWQAHLGGLVFGFLIYYVYNFKDRKHTYIALTIGLIIGLSIKYVQNVDYKPYYPGTDFQITEFYRNIGLKNYSDKLETKLLEIYKK